MPQKNNKIENTRIIPATNNILFNLDSIGANQKMVQIRGWAFLKDNNRNRQEIGITLISISDTLLFETIAVIRPDVVNYFKKEYRILNNNCGFNFTKNWPVNKIPPGHYQVGICIMKNKKMTSFTYTNQVFNLTQE